MRKITISDSGGFCFGVRRALEISRKAAEGRGGCKTLGPLVHNDKVVASLEEKGISSVDNPEEAAEGTLIIRSHGVAPGVVKRAEELGIEVIDATCPFVKKIHGIVTNLGEEKTPVIVIGKKEHPEVQGIIGYAGESGCMVVNTREDVEGLPPMKRAGVVVQTTKTEEEYAVILSAIRARIPEVRAFNTICSETKRRQKAAAALAAESDVVVVAGGRHSSNTSKLFEIAGKGCNSAHFAEDESDLRAEWFEGAERIGLICGASTPIEELEKIRRRIDEISPERP